MLSRPTAPTYLRRALCAALGMSLLAAPVPSLAQVSNDEARVRKLEAEVRALQRRVFPGGDGRFFEAEIAGQPAAGGASGGASTTAVTDILARLDALELQLQRLTASSEENSNAIRLINERLDAGASAGMAPAAGTEPVAGTEPAASAQLSPGATRSVEGTGQSAPIVSSQAASSPTQERLQAVQAIAKPQSDDAADDEYSYGFRLWNAGFYPEAQQQLTMFVEQYPSHWRATYGRNLLGRAYLDDGKPRDAAPWFLNNYQADKAAARAGDSLLYLAEAMIALEDTNRACIALAEFAETYPALAAGRLQNKFERHRGQVSCN